MKTVNNAVTGNSKANVSLHDIVDNIIARIGANHGNREIVIRNDIAPDLYSNTNDEIVSTVIDGMLNAMLAHAADGDIDITARELFNNTIKLSVKDNNCYNTYAVACSLQNLVPLTEKIGGYLNITNQRQKITTIEFSFPIAKEDGPQAEED